LSWEHAGPEKDFDFEKGESVMSWSVSAVGKSDAVARKLAAEFETIEKNVQGPEVEVVKGAAASIAATLAAQVPAAAVKVSASGSQSSMGQSGAPTKYTNSCSIAIEPLHGFVE
jgi:hypothetical protein